MAEVASSIGGEPKWGNVVLIGVGVGAPLGALVGAAVTFERWQRVRFQVVAGPPGSSYTVRSGIAVAF